VFLLHGPVCVGIVTFERESAATGVFGATVELYWPCTSIATHTGGSSKSERIDRALTTQASESVDILDPNEGPTPPCLGEEPQGSSGASQTQVLVDLLRQVSPLLSEQPEDILRLFVRLGEIHDVGFVQDRIFITRLLPLVSGSLLQFLGT
jgi:hypothetical protein